MGLEARASSEPGDSGNAPTERFQRVLRAIDEIRQGRMIILVDDEDRENEGDLCMAAEKVTPEAINFMARHGRGLICLTLTEERTQRLQLPMMVNENRAPMGTAFTVSIEARHGVSTGISAHDRSITIKTAVAKEARPEDLVSPGHVFPLRARRGGVLVRTGQTEGSVDLARLAGLEPSGVICEIMRDDGQMARMPDLERFAEQHGLMILTIADLIDYRLRSERLVSRVATGLVRPAILGGSVDFVAHVYGSEVDRNEYLALVCGDVAGAGEQGAPVLVRVQSMCPIGDVFASRSCDCEWQLREALRAIAAEGRGVFLYVYPQGRTSLVSSFQAHVLHRGEEPEPGQRGSGHQGALRDFGQGAQVLADVGVRKIRLLSNNPKKIAGIGGFGIEVVERVPIEATATTENLGWLRERREREGYLVSVGNALSASPSKSGE
ncbi:MAG: 3,4-dihydroxy-2-butanone-4-phosphate synthase [Deltaproteobacteria bacterium]|nr:3,4-dihydroxy-2-butanone-4-phosphate synthase [Deltaproteobacteria bacterium]